MESKIKIDILPNQYRKEDGTFDKKEAIKLSGKIAGVCYDKEGFKHLENEPEDKTNRRINMTLNNGHHSVYDHINISLNIQNIPKMLAMVINNEHQYTTSEKSGRYTPVVCGDNSIITEKEEELYNKWVNIFKIKIKEKYGNIYSDFKIKTLAQENARYLVTVFMPAQMIYTTSLRQINYIASWMLEYGLDKGFKPATEFDKKLADSMGNFVEELDRLNILEPGLMRNEKHRKLSLFGENLNLKREYFGDVYSTNYEGSLVQLAQAQRHRTLDYQMEFLKDKEYYVPPILDDISLVEEWLADMAQVKNVTPQGEIVRINEMGKYEDFILKCKERLCTASQLEIMEQTKFTLQKYKALLEFNRHPLSKDIEKYTKGARCTFPDFECSEDCKFGEGKRLVRKI